jgi:hypothetical protein
MRYNIIIGLLALSIPISCHKSESPEKSATSSMIVADSLAGVLIAENIIQDIVIKNYDPDDAWTEECLKGMKREVLVNMAFDLAYSGKARVYDFDTNERLTVRQLKQLERKEGFSRDKIGKIQFIESWYLHPEKVILTKKVSSMVLGYETYDSKGEFRGYLPVFRMMLN